MILNAPRACRILILAVALTGLASVTVWAGSALRVGEPFPSLALPDVVTGQVRDARELMAGRVGALVFMQTTCGVCKIELRAFKEFSATFGDDLVVVAVSVDSGGAGRVVGFKKVNDFPFTFLHDPQFETPQRFSIFFTPGLILTGPDGNIELIKSGFQADDKKSLSDTITQLSSGINTTR